MKGYIAALGLPLLLCVAGAASATTAVLDFNTPANSTANTLLVANGPNGKTTMANVGGRNAVQTGGTSDNEFLYVSLPKDMFKGSKALWATIEYYDQGTDQFQVHYWGTLADPSTPDDTTVGEGAITKHDTKAWLTHTWSLPAADFTEMGPGGADIWIDDLADGPEVIDKITVTDEDPTKVHWPHVDPAHPIKIDGTISPGEWDNAYSFTVNTAAQDALAGANWTGPNDFSGTYYYKWDETGVYIRGDVTDATPRLNDAGGSPPNYWNGDGFQVYLGLDWSDPTHATYLEGTDFDVFVGLGDTPMWALEHAPNNTVDDWGAIPTDNLAIKNTDNPKGYQFEFFLPWQKMLDDVMNTKTKITSGQSIGWFMFANNSKEIGPSAQDVAMSPFSRTHPSSTPSSWSTVVLEPFQAQPATNPPATTGGTTGGATTGGTATGGTTTGGTTTGTPTAGQ